jgi:formylglycine-generating enzyme required for sulfatase activity
VPEAVKKGEEAKAVEAQAVPEEDTRPFHTEAVSPEFLDEPTLPQQPKRPEPQRAPPRASAPPPVAAAVVSRCPAQMLRIPSGAFRMGTEKEDLYLSFEDLPAVSKEVKEFCIDAYEYPNRSGQVPLVNVSWAKAQELCQGQGKRLCTEAEWEKACRGSKGLRWPYSNVFDYNACNSASETGAARALAASGKFSRCVSPHAVFDMSGNLAEWTEEKVVKGGSFLSSDVGARCAARKPRVASTAETGFRCCANLK